MFFSEDNHIIEIIGIYRYKRKRCKRKSFSRSHSIISVRLSGESEFKYEKGALNAGENQLLYIPSKLEYSQKSCGEEIISVCFIEYNTVLEDMEIIDLKTKENFINLYEIWTKKENGYRTKCASLFYEILHKTYLSSPQNEGKKDRKSCVLRPAIRYIYEHFRTGNIDVKHLASLCFVSETYFRKIFKETYSLSPNQYIKILRLETATSLLESGFYSVNEVAEKSGFNDVKYFSKEFKKRYLVSPSKYKNHGI